VVEQFAVHAPVARQVTLFIGKPDGTPPTEAAMTRSPADGMWRGNADAEIGDRYWFVVDGIGPLLDPDARDVVLTPGGPCSAVRPPWPARPHLPQHHADPIVYELHVRGFARTFHGCIDRLDYLADLGINVIELMPIHPFDATDNYWGYMPIVWGAVHRDYAAGDDAAEELAELVDEAHRRGIEVWLDVVFNHTGEGDATMPTWSLRGFDDAHAYLHLPDGSYNDDAGCGNVINPADPYVRSLVMAALQRFADLGIDGFRFDLASILTREGGGLVEQITAWAGERGVRLIAEPWDLAEYQVGQWPRPWLQWNDRFRDEVRGFVRAEPGLVPALMQRLQGSPDLFGAAAPVASVNFVTAHDGLTMHDLTVVTSDRHHSWDCGPELRLQQLKNYFTLLLLAAGTPMFVMGDEFGRSQGGLDNPYDIDSAVTWVDWDQLDEWRELHDYVRALIDLRNRTQRTALQFFGLDGPVDTSAESRGLAWLSGDLYVAANACWEAASFSFQVSGEWERRMATAPMAGDRLAPRSIVVWQRVR
jgi:glycogen operon protein